MKAKVISFLFYLLVLVVLGVLVACEEGGLTGVEGVTVDRPFAYIVRNFPDMGDTSSVDSRPVLDPRSPYDFNPGARLYVRDRIALTSEQVLRWWRL